MQRCIERFNALEGALKTGRCMDANPLSTSETKEARLQLIKWVQQRFYGDVLMGLTHPDRIFPTDASKNLKNQLGELFLDEDGLLRT